MSSSWSWTNSCVIVENKNELDFDVNNELGIKIEVYWLVDWPDELEVDEIVEISLTMSGSETVDIISVEEIAGSENGGSVVEKSRKSISLSLTDVIKIFVWEGSR